MAFTSYDSIISAFTAGKGQERYFHKVAAAALAASAGYSFWAVGSQPAAGSFGGTTPGLWVAQDSSTAGALSFANPTAPDTLHLSLVGAVPSASAGQLLIYDRLGQIEYLPLQDGSLPETTSITSDFTARLGTGEGAQLFAEMPTSVLAAGAQFYVTYTNQAGVSGRTSETIVCSTISSAATGRFPFGNKFFIGLQAGDTGVRSVQSVVLTASSGTAGVKMNLVACNPLTVLPLTTANIYVERDLVLSTVQLPRIRNNACIAFALLSSGTNTPNINGRLVAVAG
jgi:hypothetical protein